MLGHLGFAWWLAAAAASASGSEAGDCHDGCNAIAEETDRQTCLLQCGQQDAPRKSGVTTWRREERLGGAPPGSKHEAESGTTTTTETTASDGSVTKTVTTTSRAGSKTVTAAPSAGPSPSKPSVRPAAAPPPVGSDAYPWWKLARCQADCDPDGVPASRATCKLQCLRVAPAGVVRPARRTAPR